MTYKGGMNMRILFIANNAAGLYAFRRELVQELMKDGEVYVSTPNGVDVDNLISLGCHHIETMMERHGTNPVNDIKLLVSYIKLIKKIRPDVVLTYTVKPNTYGGIACRILKVPYITNITGLGVALENKGIVSSIVRILYKIGLKKSSMVFFQNSANRDYMLARNIVSGESYLLPGSGINLEMNPFEEYPQDDSNPIFLIIGRIMKDKGIDEVLDAIRIIKAKHNNVTFQLIGGYDEDYRDIINHVSNEQLLEYIGYIDNVHDYLKNSHATINASYHEGLSNVLLETAATGRPILASDIPGCKETVQEGVSGILFQVKSADAIVQAVETFLTLPYEKKVEMGRKGREWVEKHFDRTIVVNKYSEVISTIIYK